MFCSWTWDTDWCENWTLFINQENNSWCDRKLSRHWHQIIPRWEKTGSETTEQINLSWPLMPDFPGKGKESIPEQMNWTAELTENKGTGESECGKTDTDWSTKHNRNKPQNKKTQKTNDWKGTDVKHKESSTKQSNTSILTYDVPYFSNIMWFEQSGL